MKEYELWLEGFAVTGQSGSANIQGKEFGNTFEEAVRNYSHKHPTLDIKEKDNKFYILGCRFYDNELDARKSFG